MLVPATCFGDFSDVHTLEVIKKNANGAVASTLSHREVIRKLRPTRIAGVHGDDHVVVLEGDLNAHEVDVMLAHYATFPEDQQLLRYHGQHLRRERFRHTPGKRRGR